MNEIIEKETIIIENLIYEIRGVEVMLDSDLAKLYKCTNGTKDINKAVKRNISKFPQDFYFQLTEEETKEISLRFQNGTLNSKGNLRGQHIKYLPYVFTEQGIAMLSSVLHTDIAEKVSIDIMRSFVKMRKYFAQHTKNNEILINHENRLLKLENVLEKFKENKKIDKIFFEGELYDSYSLLLDIFGKSKIEIIILDNYASKELLDILKKINKEIIVVSKNIDGELRRKYESQYHNIKFINNNTFHDRFIIIDKKTLYTCGASFKDLGKKCFYIGEINNEEYLNKILKILNI